MNYSKTAPLLESWMKANSLKPKLFGSNYCDIGIKSDKRTGRVIVISAIDNLVKGASGQAIQNMNLMMGFDEKEGLKVVPLYP